jgi:peptidoglycan hydrolase-like protein with peptidoglycan-binding domain
MDAFRAQVAAIMNGSAAPPIPIPSTDGKNRPTLRRGARGDRVAEVQAKVGVTADGVFGSGTEAAVRQFQRDNGLVPDGIVRPKTWEALG